MLDTTLLRTDQDQDMALLSALIETLDTRLRAAEETIALLNDRLAWAEAELADHAAPFVPVADARPDATACN